MLLTLRGDHKEHLNLLIQQSTQVLVDFCKLAIDYLQNGPNDKLYATAAQKLQVEESAIQNCVVGLLNLLIESCKHRLSEADFRDSVLTVGFSQDQQAILSKFYQSKQNEVVSILNKLSVKSPHYHDLNWRFEAQIASRSLLHQVTPMITMDLVLKTPNAINNVSDNDESSSGDSSSTANDNNKDNLEHIFLQTDPHNLLHLAEELERALVESRSRHSRKMQRIHSDL